MTKKQIYERALMTTVAFNVEDIITTSTWTDVKNPIVLPDDEIF